MIRPTGFASRPCGAFATMRSLMRALRSCWWMLTVAALAAACGGDDEAPQGPDAATIDAPVDGPSPDGPFVAPTMLSETGLYSDIAAGTIAPDVIEYAPRWQLWSDRAVKRRWLYLPPGAKIDTSDMDFWSFPPGTKLWKEFTRDGVRVETRLLQKIGATDDLTDWFMVSFQWNQAQTDAVAVPAGVVDEAGNDDIPSRSDCRKCHGPHRNPSVVLGIGALQMDFDAPQDGLDLGRLVAEDRLTHPPTAGAGGAYFPLPASGASDPVVAALGYLHANCGGCHNERSELTQGQSPQTPMRLRLASAPALRESWQVTPAYSTTVNVRTTVGGSSQFLIVPGDVAASTLHGRMVDIGPNQMPPLGRETPDATGGVASIRDWILSLE